MGKRSIPKLQTVDQGGWGTPGSGNRGVDSAGIIARLIAGFNLGVVLVLVAIFVILPLVLADFDVRRASDDGNVAEAQSAYIWVSETPRPTTLPSDTPASTLAPTSTVTPAITNTPAPTTPAPPSETPTEQVRIQVDQSTDVPTGTPVPPTVPPAPASYRLTGITFHQQGWNNCGPANLAMGLSYFGWEGDQNDTASFLKPEREDRNVSPEQMVDYVQQFTNYEAVWRAAGDVDLIKQLIANEFVVIVEAGYDPRDGTGWYGHYETVVAYNDATDEITVYDSNLGTRTNPSITRSYEEFDADWQSFNRNYIVIFEPFREAELQAMLGDDWVVTNNRRKALEIAQREASADPENPFTWFNLGTSFTYMGRYEEAVVAFRQSFDIGLPYRMMWYQFTPYEALLQTQRYSDVLTLANETLGTTRYVEETFYYKGRVYEMQQEYELASENYKLALDINPNYSQANQAAQRVQ